MQVRADWQLSGPLLALWPFRSDVWRLQGRPAQQQLLQLLRTIAPLHAVMLAVPAQLYATVRRQIGAEFPLIILPYNDAWPRDFGPLWLHNAESDRSHALQFDFHAWQGLYPDYQADLRFAGALTRQLACPLAKHNMVLEGGAISTNGDGIAIAHAVSLQRNNPHLRLSQIAAQLKRQLGLRHIFWLYEAHPADETGGHSDNQVQFVDRQTIAHSVSPQCLSRLQQDVTAAGLTLRWLALPPTQTIAANRHDFHSVRRRKGVLARGQRPLLASYVNFIRVADLLLLPQFGVSTDQQALLIMREHFPQLRVFGVAADEFIKAGGGPHCLTLNLPESGALSAWMNNSNKR